MESEKVKEIKKALECMSGVCKDATTRICWNCKVGKKFNDETACKEALTLINELESENKRLVARSTLKQFAESFRNKCVGGGIFPAFVARKLEETLKEFNSPLCEGWRSDEDCRNCTLDCNNKQEGR